MREDCGAPAPAGVSSRFAAKLSHEKKTNTLYGCRRRGRDEAPAWSTKTSSLGLAPLAVQVEAIGAASNGSPVCVPLGQANAG